MGGSYIQMFCGNSCLEGCCAILFWSFDNLLSLCGRVVAASSRAEFSLKCLSFFCGASSLCYVWTMFSSVRNTCRSKMGQGSTRNRSISRLLYGDFFGFMLLKIASVWRVDAGKPAILIAHFFNNYI